MASKYIKKFKVPDGFEDTLNDFAKEILRNQPKDIIDFGIEYFKGIEEGKIVDYKYKGENRPEKYKPPENKKPNIISVQNNLEMSKEDLDRLKRSQDKIDQISQEVPTVINRGGDKGIKIGGKDKKPAGRPRYDENTEEEKGEKPEYGDWFMKHSQEDMKNKIHSIKEQQEEYRIDDKVRGIPYDQWFEKHSKITLEGKVMEMENEGVAQGGSQGGHGGKGDAAYGEWFLKHSQEDMKNKINKPEQEKYVPPATKRIPYDQWFDKHAKITLMGGTPEGAKLSYGDWFMKHSQDSLEDKIKEYKEQGFKIEADHKTKQIPYNQWFKTHSSVDLTGSEEEYNVSRVEISYENWFTGHALNSDKDGIKVKDKFPIPEINEEVKKLSYEEWFNKNCMKNE